MEEIVHQFFLMRKANVCKQAISRTGQTCRVSKTWQVSHIFS